MRPFFISGHQFSAMPTLPIFTLITILMIKCIVPRRLSGKLICDLRLIAIQQLVSMTCGSQQ